MDFDFGKNHFELFRLPVSFRLDEARLDAAYRDIQSQVHPDRYAQAGATERRLSMQWATRANEAYRTLKKPLDRARYLLQLHGVDTREETNTAMPGDFLMSQLEWREAVAEARQARDVAALERLAQDLSGQRRALEADLERLLDAERDFARAAETVRKLRFLEKLDSEIAEALAALEDE